MVSAQLGFIPSFAFVGYSELRGHDRNNEHNSIQTKKQAICPKVKCE